MRPAPAGHSWEPQGRRMFKDLMTSRCFAPLFWCQLCSALNDNFLKNALVMLILSFTLLFVINGLQAWTTNRTGRSR